MELKASLFDLKFGLKSRNDENAHDEWTFNVFQGKSNDTIYAINFSPAIKL